jgi:putative permease
MNVIRDWVRRHFSDPQVVILALALLAGFLGILFFGRILAPVLASMVIAYLLEGVVARFERRGARRILGVIFVFTVFMLSLVLLCGLLPLLSKQIVDLGKQIPVMITKGQDELMMLPERFPELVATNQVEQIVTHIGQELTSMGPRMVEVSWQGILNLFTILIYLILVPLMVFFFLKDKEKIKKWFAQFIPAESRLAGQVWRDVDLQIGNYIRGKVWEILLVWAASYVTFTSFGLDFAMLISLFVGLSVLVPYIGAAVMTLPIAIIGYFDFGFTWQLAWVLIAYGIIQLLDGNLLGPLLLSEVVNLHPVAIIVAVIFFGGIWGFWGVFFAIPLATLVQSVLKAWLNRWMNPKETSEVTPESGTDS